MQGNSCQGATCKVRLSLQQSQDRSKGMAKARSMLRSSRDRGRGAISVPPTLSDFGSARAMHTFQDTLAEWSKALAPGASPQGRGLEPHSCQLVHKRQRAQLHVDRARSALLASSGSCPQQNKGEMCCLSVFYPGYPGCLVDMSSPASMPAVVSSRELQCCCCCCSEHDSLAEWSKALDSGASP